MSIALPIQIDLLIDKYHVQIESIKLSIKRNLMVLDNCSTAEIVSAHSFCTDQMYLLWCLNVQLLSNSFKWILQDVTLLDYLALFVSLSIRALDHQRGVEMHWQLINWNGIANNQVTNPFFAGKETPIFIENVKCPSAHKRIIHLLVG